MSNTRLALIMQRHRMESPTRHSQKFIDRDLEAWRQILEEATTWPVYATSYRGVAWLTNSISRHRIKRLCRDWPHHAVVLDGFIEANRRRYL